MPAPSVNSPMLLYSLVVATVVDHQVYAICNEDQCAQITAQTANRQQYHVNRFGSKVSPAQFGVGDFVYVFDSEKAKQKHCKLEPQWTGPYRIIRGLRDDAFDLTRRGRILIGVHIDRMKRH